MTNKELKAKYIELVCTHVWNGDKCMADYMKKEIAFVVELKNGDLLAIDKPRIQTEFCFGHGYCGRTSPDDESRAFALAEKIEEDVHYFIQKNLGGIDNTLHGFNLALSGDLDACVYVAYSGNAGIDNVVSYELCKLYDNPENRPGYWQNRKNVRCLDNDDILRIIAGYEQVKADFEKRLERYLKRYGLSRVHSWTYLSD